MILVNFSGSSVCQLKKNCGSDFQKSTECGSTFFWQKKKVTDGQIANRGGSSTILRCSKKKYNLENNKCMCSYIFLNISITSFNDVG